ncbi:signal recognition particle 68 kDa [Babesia ovis]|uniref:Signal recognition particle subunit SRP68 n=1 Tax=Babesia ovis TaxID=5869 RepID=A0A9W5TB79_BABOV|nr:signal recognition particle 68 kDa [Babesia ovis]
MASSDQSSPRDGEGPAPVILTFPVLDYVNDTRFKHGIRSEEYGRYHGYCSKRLCNLRRQLRISPIKSHKYVREEFPEVISDTRYLEILALTAERCWSYGMVLKSQCEASHTASPELRHRYIKRLEKALKTAERLEKACQQFAETNSINNARVYRSFMEGVVHLEHKQYNDAFGALSLYANVMEQRHRANQDRLLVESYASQLNHVNAMVKLCSFHIRSGGAKSAQKSVVHEEDHNAELISVVPDSSGNLSLFCRGAPIHVESQFLLQQIMEAINSTDKLVITDVLLTNLATTPDTENQLKTELVDKYEVETLLGSYEEIMTSITECTDTIHSEMMVSVDAQEPLRRIEGMLAIIKTLLEMEKCGFMCILALFGVYNYQKASPGCRSLPDCGEPLRFVHILKQQLETLMAEPSFQHTFHIAQEATRSINAMLMGLHKLSTGEFNDGMALINWSNSRLHHGIQVDSHCGTRFIQRSMFCFQILHKCAQLCISKYYSRAVAIYGRHRLGHVYSDKPDLDSIFGLKKQMLPCKPILFDLAQMYNDPPVVGHKSGLIGGVKNMLSSFWK